MGYASRKKAQDRAAQPAPRLIFGLTKRQKQVTVSLSHLYALADAEKNTEPKGSRLYRKWEELEGRIGELLDEYRIQRFHNTDLEKAKQIFSVLDETLQKLYPL